MPKTYAIRIGDDGKWIGEYSVSEARVAAMELAYAKFGNAVIRNNATGDVVARIRGCKWVYVTDEIRWY